MFCSNCGTKLSEGDTVCPKCGTTVEIVSNLNSTNSSDSVVYASGFERLGAYIIDFFIIFAIAFVLGIVIAILGIPLLRYDGSADLFSIITGWLYFALQESSNYQSTIGQRVLKLKVVDYDFQKISFLRATGRHFAQIISALILMIGYLMIFFTQKRQGLHDMIAKTLVIKS